MKVADNVSEIFLYFPENWARHFISTVSFGELLNKIPIPISVAEDILIFLFFIIIFFFK